MYGGVCIFIHKKVSMFYSALDDILKLFLQIVILALFEDRLTYSKLTLALITATIWRMLQNLHHEQKCHIWIDNSIKFFVRHKITNI